MSSGSYFTIYRRSKNEKASKETIDVLKNEYFLSNKNSLFGGNAKEEDLKNDIPLLMHNGFKSGSCEDNNSYEFFDKDGVKYVKLLDFHFGSSFSNLKDKFRLNPYKFNTSSVFISKDEAKMMLQAIKYILSGEYSRKTEDILSSNEYLNVFGENYSPFAKRFNQKINTLYIDKDGEDHWTLTDGDYQYENEIAEEDDEALYVMNVTKACLEAFLMAEEYSWENEELVLEYSCY